MKLYGILAYPTHIVIDQNGKISMVQVGGHEVTGKLIKVLDSLLKDAGNNQMN